MSKSTVMVAALILIAGALLSQSLGQQAEAVPVGPYQIAPQANTGNAWIVNTATGQVRLCLAPATKNLAAECLSWTQ